MDGGHGHVTPRPDGLKARCGGPGVCAVCSQEAATAGFWGAAEPPPAPTVRCPSCGTEFTPPARVTEG